MYMAMSLSGMPSTMRETCPSRDGQFSSSNQGFACSCGISSPYRSQRIFCAGEIFLCFFGLHVFGLDAVLAQPVSEGLIVGEAEQLCRPFFALTARRHRAGEIVARHFVQHVLQIEAAA